MPSKVVLERWECSYLAERSGGWLLVYGRRKTGKTWLLRRCVEWSLYATVARSGECILEEPGGGRRIAGLGECMDAVVDGLRRGRGTVVIDEFQRLPERYWDLLAVAGQEAEAGLIACGSSLGIATRVFDQRSPLLGLFEAFRVDLVDVADAVVSLRGRGLSPREAVLWSVVARDPWLLMHVEPRGEPWRVLAQHARGLVPAARGLVGEVFVEEERQLSRVYDAVLQLLAKGYWRAGDIAARLYAAGLVSSPQPGSATGVLRVLEEMGLVEKVPLWRTRGARVYYRHRSPLVSLLYQVADAVEELGAAPSPEALRARYGVELQFTLGELLAKRHGMRRAYSIQSLGRDVDVVLLDRGGRAGWGYEVKMGSVTAYDAESAAAWIRSLGIPRAGIVALGGVAGEPRGLDESLDAEALVEEAEKLSRRAREQTAP
ncbi:MAG TPA: ATP-binding protein [Pyrodictium sp.]|nr:ATP-binding protein [Pyrodictium sp.]